MTAINPEQHAKTLMSNKAYDTCRWITQYALPGTGTLYFTLSTIWGWCYGEEIMGSVVALCLFLGVVLGISKAQYDRSDASFDGTMLVDTSGEDRDVYHMYMNDDVEELKGKDVIRIKVTDRI